MTRAANLKQAPRTDFSKRDSRKMLTLLGGECYKRGKRLPYVGDAEPITYDILEA